MKKVFKIDLLLYLVGVMTVASGITFHIMGHNGYDHHSWVMCAIVHTVISSVFVWLVAMHLITHKGWIKGLKNRCCRKKSMITIILAIIAVVVAVTGFGLLAVSGANSHLGLLHYKLGIVFALLAVAHSVRRFRVLKKALK